MYFKLCYPISFQNNRVVLMKMIQKLYETEVFCHQIYLLKLLKSGFFVIFRETTKDEKNEFYP